MAGGGGFSRSMNFFIKIFHCLNFFRPLAARIFLGLLGIFNFHLHVYFFCIPTNYVLYG